MLSRAMRTELLRMVQEYPVVTVMGPRQAGKTTLVKHTFPDKPYINMESPDTRQLAESDPRGLLARYPDGAIIDEIQRAPELLSYIQVIVDERRQNGQYILTGSHQLDLHEKISQSLAGRTAILNLLPLSFSELSEGYPDLDKNELMYRGFLPRVHAENQQPTKAYRNYLQTYIERDVRSIVNVQDLGVFHKFITLCASRVGCLINYDNMGSEIGVSNNTIKKWLSILEASYIIIRLQPYFANIGKRLIKSPKLYFTEVGLATYLLGIESAQQVSRDPLHGQLFENMVVLDLIKQRYNQGLDHHLFFYRDQQKHEVDLIYQKANQLIPIEIKSSTTYNKSFTKPIDYFSKLAPEQCKQGYVIYAGKQEQSIGWRELRRYRNAHHIVRAEET